MGALCVWDLETGEHVATGKAEGAGTRHVPVWGEWVHDMVLMRSCRYPLCELDQVVVDLSDVELAAELYRHGCGPIVATDLITNRQKPGTAAVIGRVLRQPECLPRA